MAGASGLTKAILRVVAGEPTHRELRFLFNPTEYTVTKGATWNRAQTTGARSATRPQFGGSNPQTIQMELFLDDWEGRSDSVASAVDALLEWTRPTRASISAGRPEPPILTFEWGSNPALSGFRGYMKSVSAKYTLFDGTGRPLRASANVTLEEVPTEAARQNPTSGSRPGQRTRVLAEGDTLQSVAWSEYGDPTLWRSLALTNGLEDPQRLRVGTSLLVPSLVDARRGAA